jgi:hypothetical protein
MRTPSPKENEILYDRIFNIRRRLSDKKAITSDKFKKAAANPIYIILLCKMPLNVKKRISDRNVFTQQLRYAALCSTLLQKSFVVGTGMSQCLPV